MIDLDAFEKEAREAFEGSMQDAHSKRIFSELTQLIAFARAAADSLPKIKEGEPAPIVRTWQERAENTATPFRECMEAEIAELRARLAPASQAAAPQEPTAQQIHAAARKMCDLSAEACGVDKDDNWTIYGDAYNEEAKIVLTAAALAGAAPVEAAKNEGWNANEGTQPVADDVLVEVEFRNGTKGGQKLELSADCYRWFFASDDRSNDSNYDIVRWRVRPAAPAPEAQ